MPDPTRLDLTTGCGTVTARGKALEWAYWPGDADRPVIVMLHEGLGCVALWRDFPARLASATGCPVFAYSRAGYGQSDAADLPFAVDYMTREAIEVLPDVLDAVGAQSTVLLGHSDGATIAAEHAGRMTDPRVRGLVLMAPHFFTEERGLAQIRRAATVFETTDLAEKMGKYHRDPVATFRGWNGAWLNPDFAGWDVSEVIDSIRVPVLAIQGRGDEYGTLAQIREIEARSPAPVDLLALDACRHSPHFDQPEAVLTAVVAFARRLVAPRAVRPEGA